MVSAWISKPGCSCTVCVRSSSTTDCQSATGADSAPTLITQTKGSGVDGSDIGLHGGSQGGFNPSSYYHWQNGRMHNGLIVVSFALTDCPLGKGGLAVVPGTHKGNVPWPHGVSRNPASCPDHLRAFVKQVACKAGDAVSTPTHNVASGCHKRKCSHFAALSLVLTSRLHHR